MANALVLQTDLLGDMPLPAVRRPDPERMRSSATGEIRRRQRQRLRRRPGRILYDLDIGSSASSVEMTATGTSARERHQLKLTHVVFLDVSDERLPSRE